MRRLVSDTEECVLLDPTSVVWKYFLSMPRNKQSPQ